jgi:hypothetical protein
MGDTSTSVIVRLADLEANGKEINVPLVTQLTGMGVGVGTLRGNEEMMDSYGMPIWADWARNAVANNRAVNKESSFDVRSTARNLLRGWSRRIVRDDLVDGLMSLPTGSIQAGRFQPPGNRVNGIKWVNASSGNKDSWNQANSDRIIYGTRAWQSSVATSLGTLVLGTDMMTAALGSQMKRLAKQTGYDATTPGNYNGRPKITPWEIEELDEEMYVCFVGDNAFASLQQDANMFQANRDARAREANATGTNPIFTGGALLYDGILYKNIPEITSRLLLLGVGSTGATNVEPVFLCGQGAMAYAMGQLPRPTTLEDGDYEFVYGIGIEAQYGVAKVAKAPQFGSSAPSSDLGNLVDWGIVTGFVTVR